MELCQENEKKKDTKTISINIPELAKYKQLELSQIENLQGDLKQITKENLEKIKKEIIENGFVFPMMVWRSKDGYKSIDGIHRKQALLSLKDDGYMIPQYYPVIEIGAKDETEAGKRLLAFNSRYAEITQIGFENFIEKYNIKLDEINIEIPELNINYEKDYELKNNKEDIENIAKEFDYKKKELNGNYFYVDYYEEEEKYKEIQSLIPKEYITSKRLDPDIFYDIIKEKYGK